MPASNPSAVEIAYAAFPDRIYVLDADVVVRSKTMPGPNGWDVKEPRKALERILRLAGREGAAAQADRA